MTTTARLKASVETDDRGQVRVVLPLGVSVPSQDLVVECVGRSLVLSASDADPCDLMQASLSLFSDDFMEDRQQPSTNDMRQGFDS